MSRVNRAMKWWARNWPTLVALAGILLIAWLGLRQ